MRRLCSFIIYTLLLISSLNLYAQVDYKWKTILPAFDSIAYRLEVGSFNDEKLPDVDKVVDSLYILAEEHQNQVLLARTLFWDALGKTQSDIEEASRLINRALTLVDSTNYPYDFFRFRYIKANVFRKSGHWLDAYLIYKDQEDYFEKKEDWFYLANTYVSLGILFNDLGKYDYALRYFERGQDYFKKIYSDNSVTKNKLNISNTLYMLGKVDESIDILHELQDNPVAVSDTGYLITVMISYFNLADNVDKSYYMKAHQLALELNNVQLITKTLMGMGYYSLLHNQNDSALYYYKEAESKINPYTNNYDRFNIPLNLSKAYYKLGNTDSAYYYLQEYMRVSEEILAKEKTQEVDKLESLSTIEQYELEIKEKEKKMIQQQRTNRIIIIASLGAILLIAYIFFLTRKKDNIKKQLKETENKNLLLENKQLQMELDSKNRELTSNLLTLSEKNKELKVVQEKITQFIKEQSISENKGSELIKQIEHQLSSDGEWKYFKLHFEKVHPAFFSKLKQQYPKLSQNDLRLCAYIRIGMSNKEIAQIWGVLPDTVLTSRYRLKKKLELDRDESLEDLLLS